MSNLYQSEEWNSLDKIDRAQFLLVREGLKRGTIITYAGFDEELIKKSGLDYYEDMLAVTIGKPKDLEKYVDYVIGKPSIYPDLDQNKKYIAFNSEEIKTQTKEKVCPIQLNIEEQEPDKKQKKDYSGYDLEYGFYDSQLIY